MKFKYVATIKYWQKKLLYLCKINFKDNLAYGKVATLLGHLEIIEKLGIWQLRQKKIGIWEILEKNLKKPWVMNKNH